uniref:Aminopeptidase n=1 Tax=Vannella robusta TaxID=1487602 RepID=A0A7S4IIB0_9EUKA|mmetsp:Transcript_2777/g.3433  ORF Transcript_2777/g.3433 Transcript_2777/m.3433 type:complete len:853 (+) Transcript_2777:19-2577(+)
MSFERLPRSVCPRVYDIHLIPDLVSFTFEGTVGIQLDVTESVDHFLLNAAELTVTSCTYQSNDSKKSCVPTFSVDEEAETLLVKFESEMEPESGVLTIGFSGILNDQMRGFYRSKYTLNGEDRYAAVTQFESTDARRAFPCWDEPAHKSRFNITITAPSDRVVISNMPAIDTKEEGKSKTVKFDTTPIMSTYLVAFVIGEFDYVEKKTSDDRINVRVYVPVGKQDQGNFALEMASRTLPFYEKWFGIPYPLPKADLIAIPDFASGAMENWGLVTYRETALLVDEKSSSASTKQWVALVVAHELAHQWFGNLVTMEWWTHLWLNEGFASWMEYLATDVCYPEWQMWKQFVFQDMGSALALDALKSSHPIEVPVSNPSEIDEIFDDISYAKGSTVIRMLYSFLGEPAFKAGLHDYLVKHQYSNAYTEDLWDALGNASKKPVKEMMDTWTKQMGYPVITVTLLAPGKLKLVQNRFLASGVAEGDDAKPLWFVPVSIASDTSNDIHLMKERSIEVECPTSSWIKLNAEQTGFYRVRYASNELRTQLADAIASNKVTSVCDRLGVQNDAMALARAGIIPTVEALELIKAFRTETDFNVWKDLTSNLSSLLSLLRGTGNNSANIDAFGRSLYSIIAEQVGWESKASENALVPQLRSLVLRELGRYGDENTIKKANELFALYLEDESKLPADLRACVYGIVMQHGDESTYESMMSIFRRTDFQEEKERCARSLGAAADPALLQKTLEFALSPEIRAQDSVFVFCSVARNWRGKEIAWNFLTENWDKFQEMYRGGYLLNYLVKAVVSQFSSDTRSNEIQSFFEEKKYSSRALSQALETIKTNSSWMNRDAQNIMAWFAGN